MVDYVKCLAALCVMILLTVNLVPAAEQEEPPVEKKDPAAAIVNGERIPISRLDKEIQKAKMTNPKLQSEEDIDELRKVRREALDYHGRR